MGGEARLRARVGEPMAELVISVYRGSMALADVTRPDGFNGLRTVLRQSTKTGSQIGMAHKLHQAKQPDDSPPP